MKASFLGPNRESNDLPLTKTKKKPDNQNKTNDLFVYLSHTIVSVMMHDLEIEFP